MGDDHESRSQVTTTACRQNGAVLSYLVGESSDHDVFKLHIPRMVLQTEMPLLQAGVVGRDRVVRNQLTVERDLDGGAGRLDFEGIPLTSRFGSELRGRRQGVDGTSLV